MASSILLALAACQSQDLSAPGGGGDNLTPLPSLPMSSANLNCRYTPSGNLVEIQVGQALSFLPSAGNCDGAFGTLRPANGQTGFGALAPCATFAAEEQGAAHKFAVVVLP